MKETLITQEERERDNINRTSVDPQSVRESIDPVIPPAPVANNAPKAAEKVLKEDSGYESDEN